MALPSSLSQSDNRMSSHFVLKLIMYLSLASFILISLIKRKKKLTKTKKLPPGPPRLPLLGNLHQLKDPLHKTFQNLSKTYGDLMYLQLGSVPTLVISSSELTREIVKNHDVAFSGRPILRASRKIGYDSSDIVFATYGENWKESKKIATLELFNAKRVQSFQAIRDEEVQLLLNSVSLSAGTPIDIGKFVLGLTNNIICRVVFSKKIDTGSRGILNLLQATQDLVGSICLSDFFPWMWWINKLNGFDTKLEKTFKELDSILSEAINEHLDPKRPKRDQEDLVDILLKLQKDTTKTVISDGRLKGFLADMFFAGTDTSASVMEWTMAELIKNPLIMTKAKEEVRRIFKDKGKVEEADLSQLVYLKMVVKETMRLHPSVPILIPRETIESCNIRGYEIPAKTRVFINASSMSLDPISWEDPYKFRPERFLDNPIDLRGQHFEFIPFGVGRRICPAINFSFVIIEFALANLLYHFDWELPHGFTSENIDMEEGIGLSVNKRTPLCIVATPATW